MENIPMADVSSASIASGTTVAVSNATASTSLPPCQEQKHRCYPHPTLEACGDLVCRTRLQNLMRQFRDGNRTPQEKIQIMNPTRHAWVLEFPLSARLIKNWFAGMENAYTWQIARNAWDEVFSEIQMNEQARQMGANIPSIYNTPETYSMQLPLGQDPDNNDDWAINKAERQHWDWLLKEFSGERGPQQLCERLRVLEAERRIMDQKGIPSYVWTEYNIDGQSVKDLHLYDCKYVLFRSFDPLRVNATTKRVIQAWLQSAASNDPWRQRGIRHKHFNEPLLYTWTDTRTEHKPFRTSATMSLLGQSVKPSRASSSDSDNTMAGSPSRAKDHSEMDYETDVDPRAAAYFKGCGRKPKLPKPRGAAEREKAAPGHANEPKRASKEQKKVGHKSKQTGQKAKLQGGRAAREAMEEAERAVQKAEEQAERTARILEEQEEEAARHAKDQAHNALFLSSYWRNFPEAKPPGYIGTAWMKISDRRLRELQEACPEGGSVQIGGERVKFPGVEYMQMNPAVW